MKFPSFKIFEGKPTLEDLLWYVRVEHTLNLRELITGLRRLTFIDNFECFRVEVTIVAGQEIGIENKLRGSIPTDRIITRGDASEIVDGDTAWTTEHVYLKNNGATDATITVIFFK